MSCSILNQEDLALIKENSFLTDSEASSFFSPTKPSSMKSSYSNTAKVTELPRGGCIIETSIGNVQFGMPPETVKDSLNMGLDVPTFYVLPSERFDRRFGISVAEFEFPAYFNFFIKKRRVNLVCTKEAAESVKIVFQETLLGPLNSSEFLEQDCPNPEQRGSLPDFAKEQKHFAKNPFNPTEPLTVDTLVSFSLFDPEKKRAHIEGEVYVEKRDDFMVIIDRGVQTAMIYDQVYIGVSSEYRDYDLHDLSNVELMLSKTKSIDYGNTLKTPEQIFIPPEFGVTVIGSSHGFDPKGSTSGYIFWVNGRGIMLDPPPFSSMLLKNLGIPSSVVESVIISHCHADHDAGTFQKILDSTRIEIITSTTILNSFLRKYSALSAFPQDYLKSLFKFRPAIIGSPMQILGATFTFFYSLHTIPCIGFEVQFKGKSIYFSGDTFYEPTKIQEMQTNGVLSEKRAASLLNKDWASYSLILHEAGVPPIHTPMPVLANLHAKCQHSLYLVHVAQKDIPKDSGLKCAPSGINNTFVLCPPKKERDTLNQLNLLASIPVFEMLSIRSIRDLLEVAVQEFYSAGQTVIKEGTYGDKFYIIQSGVAKIFSDTPGQEFKKFFLVGDYFGETALLTGESLRRASVVAITDLSLLVIQKSDFFYVFGDESSGGAAFIKRLLNLAETRKSKASAIIAQNKILTGLSSSQKIHLEMILKETPVKTGEYLWKKGDKPTRAFLISKGAFAFKDCDLKDYPDFSTGVFIGEMEALLHDRPHETSIKSIGDGIVYFIDRNELLTYLNKYPGLFLIFSGASFLE